MEMLTIRIVPAPDGCRSLLHCFTIIRHGRKATLKILHTQPPLGNVIEGILILLPRTSHSGSGHDVIHVAALLRTNSTSFYLLRPENC